MTGTGKGASREHRGTLASPGDRSLQHRVSWCPEGDAGIEGKWHGEMSQGPGVLMPPGCVTGLVDWARVCKGHKNINGINK